MGTVRRMKTPEVAQAVRKLLRDHFPQTRFSVRSHVYSGGGSVDVDWVDGPTQDQVRAIIGHLEGVAFDGMRDLQYDLPPIILDGEVVSTGCWVFTSRTMSADHIRRSAKRVAEQYRVPEVEVIDRPWGGEVVFDPSHPRIGGDYLMYVVMRVAHECVGGMEWARCPACGGWRCEACNHEGWVQVPVEAGG